MRTLLSRHARPLTLVLALGLLAPGPAAPAAGGKAETIAAFAGAAPDWVKAALEPHGYRVTLSDGTVAGEVWFRKEFPGLQTSALLGVITFPKDGQDFRGQALPAGTYTLRYARMPEDGDHLGASATPTFALLIPVGDDAKPAEDLAFREVTKMSAKTSGTNHPAPLNLADTSSQTEFPAVATNSLGHEVLFVKLKTPKGELPVGLVLKGRTEHE